MTLQGTSRLGVIPRGILKTRAIATYSFYMKFGGNIASWGGGGGGGGGDTLLCSMQKKTCYL